jgi:diacylglycerol kinase family enzyme
LVNANAKRGGRRVAVQIARALPGASVRLMKAAHELDAWISALPAVRALLSAGGDGTAVALVNALARVIRTPQPLPVVGVLPLGTGNGWAHALGAPKLHACLDLLAQTPGTLPTHASGLFEVEGTLAHFAGSGWDAMILDDFRQQLAASRGPGRHFSKSVYGYLSATLLRTAPRVTLRGNPRVLIENLGDEVFTVDAQGHPRKLEGARHGTVLYDGAFGTASVSTCPEFGYRFRAFPFAERLPGLFNARVYDRSAIGAVASIPRLWKGQHPLPGMHDWFCTHIRMTFSRDVPLEIGGDACGMRRTVEYRVSDRPVHMVDWRRLLCLAG